ncbi:EF-hand domain-containing protein [Actinomadura craniellae]|uniref:EF-hand domain-containing protein n=1 Tax=Actinomadura craniellae TaxID=2231787 RepID=A0A365H3V9_9ACTN|nr:EF-hand domain-containing protein [Actinomadura craniellae]RAY13781.1 EF-hand domain-containing protein [Actinomadura craniellae]
MTAEPIEHGLSTAFRRVDADGDGKLDLMGFTMILEELGLSWARHETQDRFETADTDRDGLISFAEFQVLIETNGWSRHL